MEMIRNTKQDWSVGKEVKVGFLKLTVIDAKATPGDYAPDAYLLSKGNKFYAFVPHKGLFALESKNEFSTF